MRIEPMAHWSNSRYVVAQRTVWPRRSRISCQQDPAPQNWHAADRGGTNGPSRAVQKEQICLSLIIVDKRVYCCRHNIMEDSMISADLGKQLESYIQQLVNTGRYGSKSEVLREGVRLVQERETRLVALDASIMRGIADADTGRTKPASDVFSRLDTKYRAMADKAEKSA